MLFRSARVRLGLEALRDERVGREDALAKLAQLEKDAHNIGYKDIRAQVLGEISFTYAELDDEIGAFRVVAVIWEMLQGVEETILHDLIGLLTIDMMLDLERFKESHQWAEAIRNPNRRAKAWLKIVPYHCRAGDFKNSLEFAGSTDHPSYSLGAFTACALWASEKISEEDTNTLKSAIKERIESLTP